MKGQNREQKEGFHTEISACQAVECKMLTLCIKDKIDMSLTSFGLEDTMGSGAYGRVSGVILWPDLHARQRLSTARDYAYTFGSV